LTSELPQYIAVEGVIGVGKTSLARLLAVQLEASLLLEEASNNPFLADFYKNRNRFAFPTQIFFLMSRYRQQQDLMERDLFVKRIITDYLYEKDALFASVTLSQREFELYGKISSALRHDIPKPDLVIYLQASTPVIMKRIRQRNKPVEKPIDSEYIDALNEAYNSFFFNYGDAPLLVVKTDEIDFVNNDQHLSDLVDRIKKPQPHTMYYSPAGDLDNQVL
jgi:deoxyadenosine/deoxycytidine kinase